jgi:hypothetical protein
MRKKHPMYYVLLPLLYVGILVGLVTLQFGKNESFVHSWGDLTVTGRAPAREGGELLDFQIRGRGLDFTFSSARPAVVVTADGTKHKTRPVGWSEKDGGVQVSFQNGLVVDFQKQSGPPSLLVIQPLLPASLNTATRVLLPFAVENGFTPQHDPVLPVLLLRQGQNSLAVILDGGGDTISPDNALVLSVAQGHCRSVEVGRAPAGATPAQIWLGQTAGSAADPATLMSDYWTKAYTAWGGSRLKAGGWDMGNGSVRFSEVLAAAYLREALERGNYASAYSQVSALANSWGFAAMPYLGNLLGTTQAKRRQLEVAATLPKIDWSSWTLLRDAESYGPDGWADQLRSDLLNGPLPEGWPQKLGYFANLLKATASPKAAPETKTRLVSVFNTLVGAVVRQKDQVWVPASDGSEDISATLLLGNLILTYEKFQNDVSYLPIGTALIQSALGLADKSGFLPQTVSAGRPSGLIRPEELYAEISGRAPLTHALSIQGWAKPSFVRTPALKVSQTSSANSTHFTFKFPVGSAESLVIQGVPPFDHILMHGIRWRTDPDFQEYTDGWYYSATNKTLYVKITHRVENEELVIAFAPD